MAEAHCPEICGLEIAELEIVSAGVVTLGGTAGRHGLNVASGGANSNKAFGAGQNASQQVFTAAQ
jgi:hypothetical protein